jgi:hypothetical protein
MRIKFFVQPAFAGWRSRWEKHQMAFEDYFGSVNFCWAF